MSNLKELQNYISWIIFHALFVCGHYSIHYSFMQVFIFYLTLKSLTQQPAVTSSPPIDVYISNFSSSWCKLIIWSLIPYKFFEWHSPLQKMFETRQNEQRREGLTWYHVMKDLEFHSPTLPKKQLRNNNSRCHQVWFLFPAFFLSLFFEALVLSVIWNKQNSYQEFVIWWVSSLEIKKPMQDFIVVNIACWLRKPFV